MNILIIARDPRLVVRLDRLLKKQGHLTLRTSNGIDALKKLDDYAADVVISESNIPGTPLLSLTCAMKAHFPHVHFFVVAGSKTDPMARKAVVLGADNLLGKPVNERELCASLSRFAA